jgi:hypothetical protein
MMFFFLTQAVFQIVSDKPPQFSNPNAWSPNLRCSFLFFEGLQSAVVSPHRFA